MFKILSCFCSHGANCRGCFIRSVALSCTVDLTNKGISCWVDKGFIESARNKCAYNWDSARRLSIIGSLEGYLDDQWGVHRLRREVIARKLACDDAVYSPPKEGVIHTDEERNVLCVLEILYVGLYRQ